MITRQPACVCHKTIYRALMLSMLQTVHESIHTKEPPLPLIEIYPKGPQSGGGGGSRSTRDLTRRSRKTIDFASL